MINQDYPLELAARLLGIQPSFNTGGSAYERSTRSTYAFNEVLTTASRSSANNAVAARKSTETGVDGDSVSEQRYAIKSFREAREVNKEQDSACSASSAGESCKQGEDVEEADSSKSDNESSSQQADMALQELANILGLQSSELKEILESVNIEPQELIDQGKAGIISDRLSALMGLDVNQSQALRQIISTLGNALSEVYFKEGSGHDSQVQGGLIPSDDQKLSENGQADGVSSAQIVVVEDTEPAIDILQAMAKLKANLEEFSRQLQQNPAAFAAEVSEEIKTIAADNSISLNAEEAVLQEDDENSEVYGMKQISSEESEGKSLRKDAGGDDGTETGGEAASADTLEQLNVQLDNENSSQFANVIENQATQGVKASEAVKAARQSSVSQNEIVNQVVTKAKVIISGEKSEMVMDLKPDNLGKLSLKIVTERGMVVAKFIAESQQVKEAIEANMQTLKDSLEKQGLSVQGFSVSVRQDAHKGFYREDQYNANAKSGSTGAAVKGIDGIAEDEAAFIEGMSSTNPYAWGNSSINLTA